MSFEVENCFIQSDADKSLINLLTKRFNPKTKYSINAVKNF